jgi:hypothetical protein
LREVDRRRGRRSRCNERRAFDTTLPGSDELVALDVSSLMKQR